MAVTDLLKGVVAETAEIGLWAFGAGSRAEDVDNSVMETLRVDGVAVLPRFYTADQVSRMKEEVERLTVPGGKVWVDRLGSDHRLFGADRHSAILQEYLQDSRINGIGRSYCRNQLKAGLVLAGRMVYVKDNQGSGAGWHRDSPIRRQFKSILYLSDVSRENGPFEYIVGSHANMNVLRLICKGLQKYRQYRFMDSEIARILAESGFKKRTLVGAAGDLLLVDTKGIHRGSPILAGSRYAVTNYFFADRIPDHMSATL